MADTDTNTGPVTPHELLEISTGAPPAVAERLRQVREEGYRWDVDDTYQSEQLARAAACYALPYADERRLGHMAAGEPPRQWPWPAVAWKPGKAVPEDGEIAMPIEDRIRELEKAGALCAAEIDRLVRRQAEGVSIV